MTPFEVLLIAASVAASVAAPVPSDTAYNYLAEGQAPMTTYQCVNDLLHFPSADRWLSFDSLWDANKEGILHANDGDTYMQHSVHESILQIAQESDVDPRLVLATVMEKTSGKVSIVCRGIPSRCGPEPSDDNNDAQAGSIQGSVLSMVRKSTRDATKLASVTFNKADSSARFISDVANRLVGWTGMGNGFEGCYSG